MDDAVGAGVSGVFDRRHCFQCRDRSSGFLALAAQERFLASPVGSCHAQKTRPDRRIVQELSGHVRSAFPPPLAVTDDLRSYAAAASDLGITRRHERGRWRNNRAENSHQPTRRREYKMQGFKCPGSAQRFLSTHAATYNTFNVQRHLISAKTHRAFRAAAMNMWHEAVAVV